MKSKITTIIFFLLFLSLKLSASHLIGGELTCSKNANNLYRFKLHLYRDCNSSTTFATTATIYIYKTTGFTNSNLGTLVKTITISQVSGGTNGIIVPPNYYSACLTYPAGLCISEGYYMDTVTLPYTNGGYTAIYQNCCRNAAVLNFSINSGTGLTYICQTNCASNAADSMPIHHSQFSFAVCQNSILNYDYSAQDTNGDSVTYSIVTPNDGTNSPPAGFTTLTFAAGCSLSNYLSSGSTVSIDQLGIVHANPTISSRCIIGVLVSEYRNHVLIGSYTQDVEMSVTPCNLMVTDSIPANLGTVSYYPNLTVTFPDSTHPINALTTFAWDFGDPNVTTDTSSQQFPTYTYADSGLYHVRLIVNSGSGAPCTDTAYRWVFVAKQPHALGVENLNIQNNLLQVYPNPCENKLSVIGYQFLENTKLEVLDILGRSVFQQINKSTTQQIQIDISGFLKGIYFLKATDDKGLQHVAKFVKE